jgi:hypothetical protein
MIEQWVQFVRHHDVEGFHELGWRISDYLDGTPHGQYAVIMQWEGKGEPRTPLQNQSDRDDRHQRFQGEGGGVLADELRGGPDIQQPGEGRGVD